MTRKVLKFGGTSVGTIERIQHVASIVKKEHLAGNNVVVIVSAMAGKTNELIKLSKEISDKFNKRELDVLLSSGEQVTSALLAGALIKLNIKAKSLLNWQIPILTEGEHSNARITNMNVKKINEHLNEKEVVIIPGFQGISKSADILELGFPHNTPIADGGQIQGSSHRALKNGLKLKDVFQIVKKFKKFNPSKPLILMGYFNLIYQSGQDNFLKNCKASGVDGLIIVDLPYPENKNFAKKCKSKSIYFIQLLSPTTTNKRLRKIIKDSHQMNYFISMLSTTGGKLKVTPKEILKNYNKIKKIDPKKQTVIGFGITEKTIGKLKSADGLVVGSAICKEITRSLNNRQNPVTNVSRLVKNLKKKTT